MAASSLDSDESLDSSLIASSVVLAGDNYIRTPLIADEDRGNKKQTQDQQKKRKHFSISPFSSLFCRRDKAQSGSRICTNVKNVLKNCVKKIEPFYANLSTKQVSCATCPKSSPLDSKKIISASVRQRLFLSSNMNCIVCSRPARSSPSSPSSSPCHPVGIRRTSMEEVQSAIQAAIAHCKNSMRISG